MTGPISSTLSRLYGPRGWAAIGFFAAILFVAFPVANLLLPDSSPLHLSAYWVTLIGKIMSSECRARSAARSGVNEC